MLITPANGQVQKYTQTFSTMTADLMALADWFDSLHVVQIAWNVRERLCAKGPFMLSVCYSRKET